MIQVLLVRIPKKRYMWNRVRMPKDQTKKATATLRKKNQQGLDSLIRSEDVESYFVLFVLTTLWQDGYSVPHTLTWPLSWCKCPRSEGKRCWLSFRTWFLMRLPFSWLVETATKAHPQRQTFSYFKLRGPILSLKPGPTTHKWLLLLFITKSIMRVYLFWSPLVTTLPLKVHNRDNFGPK